MRGQPAGVAVHADQGAQRGDPRAPPAVEPDRAPDAGGDGVRAPVPAEGAGHGADRVVRVGVDVRARAEHAVRTFGGRAAGRDGDGERVVPRPEQVRDGDPVTPVHVRGAGHDRAVDLDGRDGVEAEGDEVDVLVAVRVRRERGLPAPVDPADPGERRLILVEVGVGDEAGGHQVEVHAARHRRGDPHPLQSRRDVAPDGPHRPPVVQRFPGHRAAPLVDAVAPSMPVPGHPLHPALIMQLPLIMQSPWTFRWVGRSRRHPYARGTPEPTACRPGMDGVVAGPRRSTGSA